MKYKFYVHASIIKIWQWSMLRSVLIVIVSKMTFNSAIKFFESLQDYNKSWNTNIISSLWKIPKGSSLPKIQKGSSLPKIPKGPSLPKIPKGSSLCKIPNGPSLPDIPYGSLLQKVKPNSVRSPYRKCTHRISNQSSLQHKWT